MDVLADGAIVAWFVGTLVALLIVLFAVWVGIRAANDEDIV